MLAETPLNPVIPASDLGRAKRFYGDTLGLKAVMDGEEFAVFESGGSQFSLYSTPSGGKAAHTLATWLVGDLDTEMADLRGRGVTFEEYDQPGLKTVNGVAEDDGMRAAWFKDSEGNILCITQQVQ
ncbi:VOC family protein [Streptomyces cylindrosporus]|uniref:VOC family protein n=1 Tax=Streptomyces cylindrosporus TaxID=2927583 RepID=A0ABS9YFY0_9ACTN|nr:VOC family protein [Streptomyces cylindrosporus]MCI3276142.1 VOC family protein [Streptomyces cylindrosporus]